MVDADRGLDARLDRSLDTLRRDLPDPSRAEANARRVVERMAVVLQGALLVRHGDPDVAGAFSVSRLGGDWGHSFGTLPHGPRLSSIIERHRPVTD